MSKIIFVTNTGILSRLIHWFSVGHSHAALVLENGNWLDARGSGGLKERPPETNLIESEIVDLPFDIETAMRRLVGRGYNFRGVIAQWLKFKWASPNNIFCSQAILAACRLSGYEICDIGREDKVSVQDCCDLLKAYKRGMDVKSKQTAD